MPVFSIEHYGRDITVRTRRNLLGATVTDPFEPPITLSHGQLRALILLSEGVSKADVAREEAVAEKTVRTQATVARRIVAARIGVKLQRGGYLEGSRRVDPILKEMQRRNWDNTLVAKLDARLGRKS